MGKNRTEELLQEDRFERTKQMLGNAAMERLTNASVIIFGVGGVGGYVAEALARSGVGTLVLVDHDTVSLSNINRQIIARQSTVGQYKVEVMKARILDINPLAHVEARNCFYLPETAGQFDFRTYDYVVDAVDTVTAKLEIIEQAKKCQVPVISCMGAGNKLDPTGFRVADIAKTSVCPLAKVMRRELKKRGIAHVKVVYSTEPAIAPVVSPDEELPAETDRESFDSGKKQEGTRRKVTPGSVSFVPSVAGLILAGEVVRDLCASEN